MGVLTVNFGKPDQEIFREIRSYLKSSPLSLLPGEVNSKQRLDPLRSKFSTNKGKILIRLKNEDFKGLFLYNILAGL